MGRFALHARLCLAAGVLSCLGLAIGLRMPSATADVTAPSRVDRRATEKVLEVLNKDHISKRRLDDEISERTLKSFLKALDPMKAYFNQEDIDNFNQSRDKLDDNLNKRYDTGFAYDVFKVFLARVDERVQLIDEILSQDQDFTVDEELVTEPDLLAYANSQAEAYEMWRKRIKYDLLVLKAEDKTLDEAKEKVARRYHSFGKRMHQTSDDELLEMYLSSVTTSYDPHTSYMSPGSYKDFIIQMRLQLDGIGAALQSEDGYCTVSRVVPGGAAEKEGSLKAKDKVIAVAQDLDGPWEDVVDVKLKDVVNKIRGKRGTIVRLSVIHDGETEPKTIKITRASIELNDSAANGKVFEAGQKADGEAFKIGIIDLPSFYMDMEASRESDDFRSTTRDVKKILDGFNKEGVDAVILDLRRNGGGALPEAINLTGLFIDTGPVVQVKSPDRQASVLDDTDPGETWKGPLVVLISKFSASASEIFAGAIQDYGRGLIVGDRATHGKGTVQSLMNLNSLPGGFARSENLGAIKITTQQFYRPNGDSTQNRGVVSDVELPSLTSHLDVGESDLDYALPFDHVEPARYTNVHQVNGAVVDQLRAKSTERCQQSEDFQKVAKDIAKYLDRKSRKSVTLVEKKFLAERAEDSKKDEEKKVDELINAASNDIKRDYYLDEAINVTLDYMQLQTVAQAAPPKTGRKPAR
ncbi:MAG: carboxy terminal-processing peptidase [Pirellulales bacterium]